MSNNKNGKGMIGIVLAISIPLLLIVCVFLYFTFRIGVEYNNSDIEVTWDAFSTSIAVLELYIVIFSIGISIVGVFGYNQIKRGAENKASEVLENSLEDIIEKASLKVYDLVKYQVNEKIKGFSIELIERSEADSAKEKLEG